MTAPLPSEELMTNRQINKRIERCNAIFDRELGHNMFRWKWAKELEVTVRKVDPDTGAHVYDYKADPITGLIVAQPVWYRRKVLPEQCMQSWVVCQFIPPCGEYEFRKRFPDNAMEYPKNGIWNPIRDQILKAGLIPTEAYTLAVAHRAKEFFAEFDATASKIFEQQDLEALQYKQNLKDKFKDQFPAFGNIPGKKESVSFGGTDYLPN